MGRLPPNRPTPRAEPEHPRRSRPGDDLFLRKIWRSTRGQWRRFLALALFIWIGYALSLSPHGWLRLGALKREAHALQTEIDGLEARRDSLTWVGQQLARREGDLLERRAREEFGFARPNERIYLLPPDREDGRCMAGAEVGGGESFTDREGATEDEEAGR